MTSRVCATVDRGQRMGPKRYVEMLNWFMENDRIKKKG